MDGAPSEYAEARRARVRASHTVRRRALQRALRARKLLRRGPRSARIGSRASVFARLEPSIPCMKRRRRGPHRAPGAEPRRPASKVRARPGDTVVCARAREETYHAARRRLQLRPSAPAAYACCAASRRPPRRARGRTRSALRRGRQRGQRRRAAVVHHEERLGAPPERAASARRGGWKAAPRRVAEPHHGRVARGGVLGTQPAGVALEDGERVGSAPEAVAIHDENLAGSARAARATLRRGAAADGAPPRTPPLLHARSRSGSSRDRPAAPTSAGGAPAPRKPIGGVGGGAAERLVAQRQMRDVAAQRGGPTGEAAPASPESSSHGT